MAKGSQFERDICRQLSLWWSNGVRDDLFWRASQSGGRATTWRRRGKALKTKGAYGDICAVDPLGQPLTDKISVECKRGYSSVSLMDLLDSPRPTKMHDFIRQAKDDATASGRSWMLLWRRDKRETLVITPVETRFALHTLTSSGAEPEPPERSGTIRTALGGLSVLPWSEFTRLYPRGGETCQQARV